MGNRQNCAKFQENLFRSNEIISIFCPPLFRKRPILPSQLPQEGTVVDLLLRAEYSPDLQCHHTFHGCIKQLALIILERFPRATCRVCRLLM